MARSDPTPDTIAAERQRIAEWRERHPTHYPTLEECRERANGMRTFGHSPEVMARLLSDMSLPLVDAIAALGRRGVGGRFMEDMTND